MKLYKVVDRGELEPEERVAEAEAERRSVRLYRASYEEGRDRASGVEMVREARS